MGRPSFGEQGPHFIFITVSPGKSPKYEDDLLIRNLFMKYSNRSEKFKNVYYQLNI